MTSQVVVHGDAYRNLGKYIDEHTVVVSDPPFNMRYHYRTYKDSLKDSDYWDGLTKVFSQAPSCVIMYPESLYVLASHLEQIPEEVCTWIYNANTARQHRDAAYFGIKPDFGLYRQPYKDMNDKRVRALYEKTGGAKSYDWFPSPQVKNKNKDMAGTNINHPCQMPTDVMKYLVGIIPAEYKILDPFAGSGSTGVACKLLDREFIGIEIDEEYVRLANARIQQAHE